MSRTYAAFALLIFLLSACAAPQTPSPTLSPSATMTFTPTASQTPEPTLTVTPNPTENAQATLSAEPNTTAKPILTPEPTPTPTQIASLINREPTFDELEIFLGVSLKGINSNTWDVELFFMDVDGDTLTDLVVLHPPEFYVLRWTGSEYQVIFDFSGGCAFRCFPQSKIVFEDWTSDNIPDIIFDNLWIGGGTSYWTYDVTRRMFHCMKDSCVLVWEKLIQHDADDYTESMMGRYAVQTSMVIQDGVPGIRSVAKGFRIFTAFPGSSSEYAYTAFEVDRAIVSMYLWNGESFELVSEETLSLSSSFDSKAVLFAENGKEVQAGIQLLDEQGHDFFNGMNKLCQLIIDGVSTDNPFLCKDDFTVVSWQDITGDGQDDVIVQTLFGSDPSESFDCAIQQHLLAYTWDGQTVALIADASGCVTRPEDLYGVRLEDYDGDSLPEIIAAQLYADVPERIYKFNGTEFVFWSEMP